MSRATLIVGIGSPHGDDQAGWLAARRLRAMLDPGLARVELAATPLALVDWLEGIERLIVCDAAAGRPAGTLRTIAWPSDELTPLLPGGTHGYGLVEVLRLAERLGRLPQATTIWAIGAGPRPGTAPTPEVAAAAAEAARLIAQLVARE